MRKRTNKKVIIYAVILLFLICVCGVILFFPSKERLEEIHVLDGSVVEADNGLITVILENDETYTFNLEDAENTVGMDIQIKYTGNLDSSKDVQDAKVVDYVTTVVSKVPLEYRDKGIFSDYYELAYERLSEMTTYEKIRQMLLVRYPDSNQKNILSNNQFGGYLFFAKDFYNKTKEQVINEINELQDVSKIPILTAVDEEGGTVVRVSSNPNLSPKKFSSPRELYLAGGLDEIASDTKEKSRVLSALGINLNLAPVVDVSTSPSDYMYSRSIGEDSLVTSEYAKTVIEASKGLSVSYTLKHFPGYGNNADTHVGSASDKRSLESIREVDLPPFEAGIKALAEAILVSHNTVVSIDPDNPASLSVPIHNLLRDDLQFTGIIITDDLAMGATSSISNAGAKAVKAGNDLIITTDYEGTFNSIKQGLDSGDITEDMINHAVFRILSWKYYKGLLFENEK